LRINNKNYKIAVVILMMEKEFSVTKLTLASLLNSINKETDVSISILLNGSTNNNIKKYFINVPEVTFYCSGRNLGVAGGRNYLFTRPEVTRSDIILLVDNDVFLPLDYVRNMCEFLISHPEAGVVGPAMLWANSLRNQYHINPEILPDDHKENAIVSFSSRDIKGHWLRDGTSKPLFHLGTYNWFLLYCVSFMGSLRPFFCRLAAKGIVKNPPYLHRKLDPASLSDIKAGTEKLAVANIAGAGQVFRTSLLGKLGLLEPAFNPWGFEDAEFCVRALRAGYKNYTNCDCWILHGTDTRHAPRDHNWTTYVHTRGRFLMIRKLFPNPFLSFPMCVELLVTTVCKQISYSLKKKEYSFISLKKGLAGWLSGLTTRITSKNELIRMAHPTNEEAQPGFHQEPDVTILTPTFNHADFITETLDSVAEQSHQNIEHLVIDGASTDNTLTILKKREDSRLKFLSEPDEGQSDAINKGIRMARGKIIGWLNSDDTYASIDVVSEIVDFFYSNPDVDVVYGKGDFVDINGNILREAYVHRNDKNLKFEFAWAVGVLQPSVFFRKKVFDRVGLIDKTHHMAMDYELWIRLIHHGVKMRFFDKKIAQARYHEEMKSAKARGQQLEDSINIVHKYYGFVHPRWIKVYAKYIATENAQIISEKSEKDNCPEIKAKIKEIEREIFLKYNSSPDSVKALLNPQVCDAKVALKNLNEYLPNWQLMTEKSCHVEETK
jgi:GT2 family glycosyltransferase